MKTSKIMSIALLILIALSTFGGVVAAQTAPAFRVDEVEINGQTAADLSGSAVYVERGDELEIEVFLTGLDNSYDTRVRAYIGGYEYGTIEAETNIFEVESNVSYRKVLELSIPDDIRASDHYTLYVEVFDDDNSVRYDYLLRVQEQRHSVTTYDVLFNPPTNVRAGQPLFTSVRVENLGDNVEESIKVTVSIPELGISTAEYVDQLITSEDLNDDRVVYAKKDSASTNDLMLLIPEDAPEGDYQVKVAVDYNRGHSREETYHIIHVSEGRKTSTSTGNVNAIVNVDSDSQTAEAGKGAVFKISVANLGEDAETYTVDVVGVTGFATARIDPQTQSVMPTSTGEFNLFVSPSETASPGTRSFTAMVKDSEGNVVSEKALTLDVTPAENDGDTLKKVLEVGFVILLVILVIVGLIVLVKKLGGEDPEEPIEGKTYY